MASGNRFAALSSSPPANDIQVQVVGDEDPAEVFVEVRALDFWLYVSSRLTH